MSGPELLSLVCNHCGAPLQPPASARFITCEHCGSTLEIKSEGGAAFTAVIERVEALGQRADQLTEKLEIVELNNELEELYRQWSARPLPGPDGEAQVLAGPGVMKFLAAFLALLGVVPLVVGLLSSSRSWLVMLLFPVTILPAAAWFYFWRVPAERAAIAEWEQWNRRAAELRDRIESLRQQDTSR